VYLFTGWQCRLAHIRIVAGLYDFGKLKNYVSG